MLYDATLAWLAWQDMLRETFPHNSESILHSPVILTKNTFQLPVNYSEATEKEQNDVFPLKKLA